MLNKERKLKITSHAFDRAKQFQLDAKKLTWLFWNSDKEPTPPGAQPDRNGQKTLFRRNGTYVMVIGEVDHKYTGEPLYLLLTVYDQRIDVL